MTFMRRNVWELGGDWSEPILWYARGVKAMNDRDAKPRSLGDKNGWRFYAAIHGFNPQLWGQLGYFTIGEAMPSAADQNTFWKQCQHGSWYFLPWHRGYLIAFEKVIRAAITGANGPKDWALPYWNYFKADQNRLPRAFASADWPDGKGDNPLYVPRRYGPDGQPDNVFVVIGGKDGADLNSLGDYHFTGLAQGVGPGFGGVTTGFSHGGRTHGGVEFQPHDMVHGLVGGSDNHTQLPGLMSNPDIAGLDPIFWLHHANIDRLWEVWKRIPGSDGDPIEDLNWMNGPATGGGRSFAMPMPGGETWTYTPGEMSSLSKLDYDYDDATPPRGIPSRVARLRRLGNRLVAAAGAVEIRTMTKTELLGATKDSLRLVGAEVGATVQLEPSVKKKVLDSFLATTTAAQPEPDRIFLNLENVRGADDATVFSVYIDIPEAKDRAGNPEHLAGAVALFGVSNATAVDSEHAGDGLTFVLEITQIVDALHLQGALDTDRLHVRLVPRRPVSDAAKISIGRISVFRQSE